MWSGGNSGDNGCSEASSGGAVYESSDAIAGDGVGYVPSGPRDGESGVAKIAASSGYGTKADT